MYCTFYCSRAGMYSRCALFDFNVFLFAKFNVVFEINAPPLSDLIFSDIPYKLKFCFRKLKNSFFVSDVLQIFTDGHLLNLSTASSSWFSPFNFLLCSFLVKSVWISCPGSVSVFNFPLSFFGIWYFKFLRC